VAFRPVSAGRSRRMFGFGTGNTMSASNGRLWLASAQFLPEMEKTVTGFGHGISASIFRRFPKFFRPKLVRMLVPRKVVAVDD